MCLIVYTFTLVQHSTDDDAIAHNTRYAIRDENSRLMSAALLIYATDLFTQTFYQWVSGTVFRSVVLVVDSVI